MEKAKHREQAVSCASAQVTDQVFMHQRDLRKSFIEQIHVDRILGKKVLHKWRKIIMSNTHSRSVIVLSLLAIFIILLVNILITMNNLHISNIGITELQTH